MTPAKRIVEAIRQAGFHAREQYGQYRAQCPAHGNTDSDLNLSVSEADDNAAVVKCWSNGCATEDIMHAVGLTSRHLFPDAWDPLRANGYATTSGKPAFERSGFASADAAIVWLEFKEERANSGLWFYHNRDGDKVGAALRFDLDDGRKVIKPLRRDADGWHIGGMKSPRPLYNLGCRRYSALSLRYTTVFLRLTRNGRP